MGATGVGVPGQQQPQAREATATRRRGKQPAVSLNLPPGFRFHPTDEELALHYLVQKALDRDFTAAAMGDVDLNKYEPWELKGQVKMVGGTQQNPEMYLFYERGRKYPTGTRTNRATTCGYWKATGKDKEIYTRVGNRRLIVGMKKTLVFYTGRAPRGGKTDWVMHEYRLEKGACHPERSYWAAVLNGESVKLEDDWVVCRVFLKPKSANKRPSSSAGEQPFEADSDDVSDDPSADEPPPLVEPSFYADRGTGVDVKYKVEDTIATPAEIKAPAHTPLSSQIQNMAADLNWNHLYTGGPLSFLNDTQNQPMMMMGGSTMESRLYNITNFIQPRSCFYTSPFSGGSMNPLLPFVDNNDNNLVYGLNPVNNVGDPFITGALQPGIVPPIRMIPTPQAPRQCKEEELPMFPSPEEMLSPESTIMSGAGCSYPSPGGSSIQQMTSGGGGSIYGDAAVDDDLFPPGIMMDVPNNWP